MIYIGDSQGLAGPWHPILRTRAGFVLLLPSRQLLNLTRTSVAGALAAPVRKPCKREFLGDRLSVRAEAEGSCRPLDDEELAMHGEWVSFRDACNLLLFGRKGSLMTM
jgi:hypothetical protein